MLNRRYEDCEPVPADTRLVDYEEVEFAVYLVLMGQRYRLCTGNEGCTKIKALQDERRRTLAALIAKRLYGDYRIGRGPTKVMNYYPTSGAG